MSARIPLSFRIFHNEVLVREERLTLAVIKVGKVASAHLRLEDEAVSRMHAVIEVNADEVTIIDLGSTRGTFVNGQKINKARLATGDTITIGATRIEVAVGEVAAVATPVAAVATPVAAVAPVMMPAVAPPLPPVRPLAVAPVAAVAPPMARSLLTTDDAGAGAVEVAAMLGDSVVAVKHCTDPRGGAIRPATYGLFIGGAAALVVAAGTFVASVSNASRDAEARSNWTNVLHKPARGYRPHPLGAGADGLMFGGLGFGLLAVTAGLVRARREKQSPYFRIGSGAGVEVAAAAPTEAFPLVAPSGDDFVCNVGHGMDGELIVDGVATPLGELAAAGRARPSALAAGAIEIPLPARAKLRVQSGLTTFLVSAVAPPRRAAAPGLAMLERRTLAYFAGALAFHLGVVALLDTVPVDDGTAGLDLASAEDLGIRSKISDMEDRPPPPPEEHTDGTGEKGDSSAGAAMELPEGKAGKPTSTAEQARLQMERRTTDPQLARQQAIEEARSAGVLGSSMLAMNNITSLTGTATMSSGFDEATMWGGMYGAAGDQKGAFGMGRDGFGPGGGCMGEGCGIIGTGRGYKIGGGDRQGIGWSGHMGDGRPMGRTSKVPPATMGTPKPIGDYDGSIIRRYVHRAQDSISYCYEKQLLAHPSIAGQIVVQFFISPNGAVTSSVGSGFDATVASCVADVIHGIAFPKSPTGGGAQVTYPFTFRNAGGAQ